MAPLSTMLEEWVGDGADPQVRDAIVWARLFGNDVERAWRECPRGDYLLLIAGACGSEASGVAELVRELAGETLPEAAASLRTAKSALRVTDQRTFGRMSERIDAMARAIDRAVDRQESESASLATALARSVAAMSRHAASLAAISTRRERVMQLPAVRALGKLWHREQTQGADAAALRIALAALFTGTAEAQLASLDLTRVGEDDDREERAEANARLFGEAAIAVRQCAAVADYRARRDGGMYERMLGALATMVVAREQSTERLAAAMGEALAPAAAVGTAKLAELADRVRAIVPFDSLRVPRREGPSAGTREAFRLAIDRMASPVRELNEPALDAALALSRAILDAPGPLDQSRFFRALGGLYEAFAEALDHGSRGRAKPYEKIARARAEEARRMAREAVAMAGEPKFLAN